MEDIINKKMTCEKFREIVGAGNISEVIDKDPESWFLIVNHSKPHDPENGCLNCLSFFMEALRKEKT